MSSSTSDDDTFKSACGQGEDTPSNKKVSASCDQKVESCNNNNDASNNTASSSFGIDAVSDSLRRVDISNDEVEKMAIFDEKLFKDEQLAQKQARNEG